MTRKAAAKNRKIQSCEPLGRMWARRSLSANEIEPPSGVAITPVATAAVSMSSEPTSV